MFASILVYCERRDVKDLSDEFYPFMSEDYVALMGAIDHRVLNKVLQDLDIILRQLRSSVFKYPIPQLILDGDSMSHSKLIHDERSINVLQENLDSVGSLNNDQHRAFITIMNVVQSNGNDIFFIDGPGGTRKTYLYRALLSMIRKAGDIAIATATSGMAATLLPGGRTAHSRFKIALDVEPSSTCNIKKTG